ncbi:MAG: HesA/MoeB/ThiF family protein [Rhodobacteraceae bacterium]|nr:HesA/MoeB/ThiF family protein [Paracoccaceae bacterium]
MNVLLAVLVIASLGFILKLPLRVTAAALGIFYLGILGATLVLPATHPLMQGLGVTRRGWLALGLVTALLAAYGWWVARAKAAAAARAAGAQVRGPGPGGAFTPAELERYARHIVLREIGGPGQRRLKSARVLVIGAGGLGSPALLYLAAAGVGTIGVIDDDEVSVSNLQRQVIHTDARLGMPKVQSAAAAMKALNPHVTVRAYRRRLTEDGAEPLFADYDLVLDGSDNFPTRYLANAAAVRTGKPLIAAAIAQWEGQISLYDPARGAPCYACVFPEAPAPGLAPACAEAGVVGALPGVMGAMMALEAIKEIAGAGESLRGRMLVYDALHAENRVVRLDRRADCKVCGGTAAPDPARTSAATAGGEAGPAPGMADKG